MPPEAYEIGLRPWEFARLTRTEWLATLDGFQRAQDRLVRQLAWQISWLTAPHVKKPVSVNKILGVQSDAEEKVWTEVE